MGFQRFRAQATAEFALVAPLILLLLAGVFYAYLYAWHGFTVDWALFTGGLATGAYDQPRTQEALRAVIWKGFRERFTFALHPQQRGVMGRIGYRKATVGPLGLLVEERHQGQVVFYLWRFYPGPWEMAP